VNEEVQKPSIVPIDLEHPRAGGATWLTNLGRRLLLGQFAKLRDGALTLVEPDGRRHHFGQRTPRLDLAVTLEVIDPQLYADPPSAARSATASPTSAAIGAATI